MKKNIILSILVLLASWWVVGQANSEYPVDDCNYDEGCVAWCEDSDKNIIKSNIEPPVDNCNYEEECECEDPDDEDCDDGECDDDSDPENEGDLCIPTNYIIFDLDLGVLKFIAYIDLQLIN
jgi:hypothetical protein